MRIVHATTLGLLLLAPVAATADGVEVALTASVRLGEAAFPIEATTPLIVCVTTPCVVADARTDDGGVGLSLIVDVPVSDRWMVEVLLTQQDGALRIPESPLFGSLGAETFDSTTALVGGLRHWGDGRIRPFAAGALGVTRFETSAQVYERPLFPGIVAQRIDEEVLAASVAGGVKIDLAPRLALRLEGRAFWHDLPSVVDGALWQHEGSVGLAFRF